MPIYKFRCRKCGNIEDLFCSYDKKKSMSDALACACCGSGSFEEVLKLNICGAGKGEKDSKGGCSSGSCGTCNSCF